MTDLASRLLKVGLLAIARSLDDFLARATKNHLSPVQILEEIARLEEIDKSRRSQESRLRRARIGRFKPMADFDWNWPKKIERDLIERALGLDFVREGRNLALIGSNGLGKTMIARNIAHQAVLAGFSVLSTTAAELIEDLRACSPETLRRRLARYARPHLLCVDEAGTCPTTRTQPICSTRSSTGVTGAPAPETCPAAPSSSPPTSPSATGTPSSQTPPRSPPSSTS